MRSETRTQQWFLDDPRTRKWIVQCAGCGLYGRRSDTPDTIPKVTFETMFPVMDLDDQCFCENCGEALRTLSRGEIRKEAAKTPQWYFAWQPGDAGYDHDDVILAVGLQCGRSAIPLQDVMLWLGSPDKAVGDRIAGHLAYFFDQSSETAALFDVVDGNVNRFGTITRNADNAKRQDKETGEEILFNFLDEMETFTDAESPFSHRTSTSPFAVKE